MTTNASSVSRQLKAAGFGVVSTRNREGIRVSRGALPGHVSITVDLDRPAEAARLADTLEEYLEGAAPGDYRRDGVQFTVRDPFLPMATPWPGA